MAIDVVSYENQLNASTPFGKLVFQIIGAVAESEKDIIRDRVVAGLANARRRGKRIGRPPKPSNLLEEAKFPKTQGLSFREIARRLPPRRVHCPEIREGMESG